MGLELAGVSCTSAEACIAVGSYLNRIGMSTELAERWTGGIWRIQRLPRPSGATATALNGAWCTSASICTSVGSFRTGAGAELTLAHRWNGKAWTIVRTPNPVFSTGSSTLESVSCTSEQACTAVGSYDNAAGRQVPLAERWNGTGWRLQQTPTPAGATAGSLSGVSCADATTCVAVGTYSTGSGAGTALVEAWNGSAWMIQSIPNSSVAALNDVSCPSSMACVAVGGWTAAVWSGTAWAIGNAAPPNPQPFGGLVGVSCTSLTSCTSVGSNGGSTLAEAWNGISWIVETTANVAVFPQGGSWLDGGSCASSMACTAVGGWSAYHQGGLVAERWDGVSWVPQSPGPEINASPGQLNRVSCPSATACVAVGQLQGASVADAWDGTTWTIQYPPSPVTGSTTTLNGVSCISPTTCTAVGSYAPGPSTAMTTQLIEREP